MVFDEPPTGARACGECEYEREPHRRVHIQRKHARMSKEIEN
jgi:hypothetical protein